MSARVLNPAMMTEMSRNLGGGRTVPSTAALARVRRDLFGPVDHAAARALAERELRAQSLLDTERWGFDFHLEMPKSNSRYDWEIVTSKDIIPEPYALRSMPYLRKHAPSTPRKCEDNNVVVQQQQTTTLLSTPPQRTLNGMTNVKAAVATATTPAATTATAVVVVAASTTTIATAPIITNGKSKKTTINQRAQEDETTEEIFDENTKSERTPPQRERSRVPEIGESTPNETSSDDHTTYESSRKKKYSTIEPSTPVLPMSTRKITTITHYMKSRKRRLNGGTKSVIEPPEKVARNAGQIRS
ncbi:PREDICTED: uncharacterized protein LOC107071126 [Polistes dominula]|uniref:Uncharacterized protein LOC107071126 n=1 Tax=Polistes dominula TaxID=743375 RepID=A0ABM1IYP8_POLDO|nr:PREDICTED: uncharacterized protein LOC107071126 [Polistes dominula]